jgi:predicted alpha-1,6-mannanase (GH76 family)
MRHHAMKRLKVPMLLASVALGCGSEAIGPAPGSMGASGHGGASGSNQGAVHGGSSGVSNESGGDNTTTMPGSSDASTTGDSSAANLVDAGADAASYPSLPGCDAVTAHARADRSLDDLINAFWNAGTKYFDATEPSNGRSTGYWTFAQAWDAVLDGAERTGLPRYHDQIATLYAAQNAHGWSSNYYDDETWMCLALMRAYDLTGEKSYLDRALALYLDITAAWDGTSAHPGGIWWNRAHTQKATASNAGPVIAGVRLAARTGDAQHLTFARQVYDFWFMTMVNPVNHQLADHINPDGTIGRGRLTYNEGLMAGAAFTLYSATKEQKFLDDANGIAGALVKLDTKSTPAGPVLADGTNTSCIGDCPQWKGIGYRYLALIFRSDFSHTEYRPVLESSVTAAWTLARNSTTGLFANDWAGPTMSTAQIEAQSSTAMALNLWAEICGPYPGPGGDR